MSIFANFKSGKLFRLFSLLFGLIAFSSAANAAVPAALTAVLATVIVDIQTVIDTFLWPLVILITVAFLMVKLFKKTAAAV